MDIPYLTSNLRVLNTFEKKFLKPTQTDIIMKALGCVKISKRKNG